MTQSRKIFVGGVPQDMDQHAFCAFFSEYAAVRKAWLQKSKDDTATSQQKHRGFGFVIFEDSHTIDALIGSGVSAFIPLKSGRLEVKRAVSSKMIGRDVGEAHSDAPGAQRVPEKAVGALRAPESAPWLLGDLPRLQYSPPAALKVPDALPWSLTDAPHSQWFGEISPAVPREAGVPLPPGLSPALPAPGDALVAAMQQELARY